jgi:rubrerythrin
MKHGSTEMDLNRTGIAMAPRLKDAMIAGAESITPTTDGAQEAAALRTEYSREAPAVGTTPPPASAKGVLKKGAKMVTGKQPMVLSDKLGERLAFERTGTRLYESLLVKFDSEGSWDGGPTRAELELIHDQERDHFEMLRETIEQMGDDPTTITPSADIAGVAAEGVLKVVADPRSSLVESLEAVLVAELTDHEGWEVLIRIGDRFGQDDLVQRCRSALREEDEHLRLVREWLSNAHEQQVRGELH